MKITGNTIKDYYDGCLSYGINDDIIYNRVRKEIDKPNLFLRERNCYQLYNSLPIDKEFIIGFCGKYYKGCKLKIKRPENKNSAIINLINYSGNVICETCYNINDVEKFVKKYLSKKIIEQFYGSYKYKFYGYSSDFNFYSNKYFKIDDSIIKELEYMDLFHTYSTPSIVFEYDKTIINPCLKDYEFFKVFDSYSTFQEISMFLNNMSFPENPMVTISDECMRDKKGFDKWSFKTRSNKKINKI